MIIRAEQATDHESVRRVNEMAFGRRGEADLVDALRQNADPYISLVAEEGERIVGHIFFSPVRIEGEASVSGALGLAPMAVLPEFQNQGVGSALVRRGLEECRSGGHALVVVLGHPEYYPRFGFRPAVECGLRCVYTVPDEAFMVMELRAGALAGRTGVVKYGPEFDQV